jgi:hypothetical protein
MNKYNSIFYSKYKKNNLKIDEILQTKVSKLNTFLTNDLK